eukprot:Skav221537  [mRNA]  locus=scaffold1813:87931:98016:+ [translate_table: standard]
MVAPLLSMYLLLRTAELYLRQLDEVAGETEAPRCTVLRKVSQTWHALCEEELQNAIRGSATASKVAILVLLARQNFVSAARFGYFLRRGSGSLSDWMGSLTPADAVELARAATKEAQRAVQHHATQLFGSEIELLQQLDYGPSAVQQLQLSDESRRRLSLEAAAFGAALFDAESAAARRYRLEYTAAGSRADGPLGRRAAGAPASTRRGATGERCSGAALPWPCEAVIFGDGRQGVITRAYVLEDKYAIRADGAVREVKGPNNTFFYFRRRDLQRALPINGDDPMDTEVTNGEPPEKKPRLDEAVPVPTGLKPRDFRDEENALAALTMAEVSHAERLAAASAAAARMAAAAVVAGRSAAVAVRSRRSSMTSPTRPASPPSPTSRSGLQDVESSVNSVLSSISSSRDPSPRNSSARALAKANQAVAAAALRAQISEPGPVPLPKECGACPVEEICEWDVTVQRTFITVLPVCKRLLSTVSAPPRLDRARNRGKPPRTSSNKRAGRVAL